MFTKDLLSENHKLDVIEKLDIVTSFKQFPV